MSMTIALWCVLAAALLPYVFSSAAKFGGQARYNNYKPRDFLDKLDGWQKRAHWVQLNSYEIFPPFAAAVLVAEMLNAPQGTVDALAITFVVSRVLYGLAYLANKGPLRSLIWTVGFGCVVALFVTAA